MKKVLLLAPRLDLQFKCNPNSAQIPPKGKITEPLRIYWDTFFNQIEQEYTSRKDVVFEKLELPMWLLDVKTVDKILPDIVLVPHKESHNFPVKSCSAYYYMQTAFPWLFSLDQKGWGAGASVYPYNSIVSKNSNYKVFDNLSSFGQKNQSKFNQPDFKNIELPKNYILFACQIPYDETIRYHSDVSVSRALTYMCKATQQLKIPLIVKSHPTAPYTSMTDLKNIADQFSHVTWMADVSVHQLVMNSMAVAVVNSGVGSEALLHKKPVITFGRSEYDCVTNRANKDNILAILQNLVYNEHQVVDFFDGWYNWCYDVNDSNSFKKLP
jgi:hypothetical protein